MNKIKRIPLVEDDPNDVELHLTPFFIPPRPMDLLTPMRFSLRHFISAWSRGRRVPLGVAGFAAVFFLLTGCTKTPEPPLRVAIIPWPGYASLDLAKSLGYFDEQQIRLIDLSNASQSARALRNGTVDAAFLTLDETLVLLQSGVDLRVVLILDVSDGADVVIARPELTTLPALRGQRIGVETSAIGAVMLDAMLRAGQLNVNEVTVVDLPVNEHAAAYLNHKVDAVVTFEPVRTQLLEQGAKILFDSSRVPGLITDVLVVRTEALPAQDRHLAALIAAHFKALNYLAQQPQDSAVRLAPYLGVLPAQVLPQFAGLKLLDLAENHTQLGGPAPPFAHKAAELTELMLQHQLLQRPVRVEHLVEPAFLPVTPRE